MSLKVLQVQVAGLGCLGWCSRSGDGACNGRIPRASSVHRCRFCLLLQGLQENRWTMISSWSWAAFENDHAWIPAADLPLQQGNEYSCLLFSLVSVSREQKTRKIILLAGLQLVIYVGFELIISYWSFKKRWKYCRLCLVLTRGLQIRREYSKISITNKLIDQNLKFYMIRTICVFEIKPVFMNLRGGAAYLGSEPTAETELTAGKVSNGETGKTRSWCSWGSICRNRNYKSYASKSMVRESSQAKKEDQN